MTKPGGIELMSTASHCAFSSNLFHRQLTQKPVDQMSPPENKKCSPWNVFGIQSPSNLTNLSRRGPRYLIARLSQHYIGPKMTFCHSLNLCRKKFPSLTKEISCTYWINLEVLPHNFANYNPQSLKKCAETFLSSQETFFVEILKITYTGSQNVWVNRSFYF